MKAQRRRVLYLLATGIVAVTLTALGLFWARWLCAMQREALLPDPARTVAVDISSLLKSGTNREPNGMASFEVAARVPRIFPPLLNLGLPQYVRSRMPGGPDSPIYQWERRSNGVEAFRGAAAGQVTLGGLEGSYLYYDASLGQIVRARPERGQRPNGVSTSFQHLTYYAGPEGIVAETPDQKIGRFFAPIAERFDLDPQIVYDRALRRFFAIDWLNQTVRQGPQLTDDRTYRPVQIRALAGNLGASMILPFVRRKDDRRGEVLLPDYFSMKSPVLVLDASGRIDLLDPETLHYIGTAGHLVSPASFFGSTLQSRPEDVLAYEVSPIGLSGGDGSEQRTYGGCVVATLARDGIGLRLNVYDANGRSLGGNETVIPQRGWGRHGGVVNAGRTPATRAAYADLPGAQVLTIVQFLLESLHPPALLALSHLAAPHLKARAGYRSVFLLPDSFVAMSARDAGIGLAARLARALLLLCPAFLLALLLAWRVARDGAKMGLSKNARGVWLAGTMALGLPAYITYRLTRPKVTLVTCVNCGVGRRPDRDKCQHCGSPWAVPELTPPAWRVLGVPEPAEENSFSREPQADSQVQ